MAAELARRREARLAAELRAQFEGAVRALGDSWLDAEASWVTNLHAKMKKPVEGSVGLSDVLEAYGWKGGIGEGDASGA